MMFTEFECKKLKTRKPHQCAWCGEEIEKAEMVNYRRYIVEDDFIHEYCHLECWDASLDLQDSTEIEGYDFGQFYRGSTEARW